MTRTELLRALRNTAADQHRCWFCKYEDHCSIHGCAINRAAAVMIEQLTAENEVLRGNVSESDTLGRGGNGVNKTILFPGPAQSISLNEAWEIVKYSLDNDSLTYKTRALAIEKVANMETHNSITKAELVNALRWLFAHYDFEN